MVIVGLLDGTRKKPSLVPSDSLNFSVVDGNLNDGRLNRKVTLWKAVYSDGT